MQTKLYFLCERGGAVRYVGKTSHSLAARLSGHLREARKGARHHRGTWIRSLVKPLEIVFIDEVTGDGCAEEIRLISDLLTLGVRLVNGTVGGDGAMGHKHSPETRAKIPAALTPERREKIAAGQRGRKASESLRRKLSKAHVGKTMSLETKAKMSAVQKRRMQDPSVRAAFVSRKVGLTVSAETRAKISAAKLGRKHTAASLEKMRASKQARAYGLLGR